MVVQPERWTPFDLVFFDCDSTLSSIEGIDELARLKGKEQRVGLLTNKAMDGELDLSEVYGKRLQAIRPTRGQLKAIEERYWQTLVEDAEVVIQALQFLDKQVFIISGGLLDAVQGFGRRLGVDPSYIRAVELEYNELSGDWWNYHDPQASHTQSYLEYGEGPLTISSGKPQIIRELAGDHHGRRIMIGDGSSDLATQEVVDLFVGYGGIVSRQKVKEGSSLFLGAETLAPILPIVGGSEGYERVLGTEYESIYVKGILVALTDEVIFETETLRNRFVNAFPMFTKGED